MSQSYEKIRQLLSEQPFPHRYIHKFIGLRTPEFLMTVEALEKAYPKAKRVTERETSGKSHGGIPYVALTYELLADSADEIVALLQSTALVSDLKIIL